MNKLTSVFFKILLTVILLTGLTVIAPLNEAYAAKHNSPPVQRDKVQVLVKYKDNSKAETVKNKVKNKLKLNKIESKKKHTRLGLELLEISDRDNITKVVTELQKEADVLYAQPNYILTLADTPLDERFEEEWGLLNQGQVINGVQGTSGIDIGAEAAWQKTLGSPSLLVGVLDTGIDPDHPDLAGSLVQGYNFITDSTIVYESVTADAHGTHIAGIIAAAADSQGVRGVAPGVRIVPLKFINGTTGYTSDAIEAIDYAKTLGVKIINCSFGGSEYNPALKDAIAQSGILFVCAAGNSGSDVAVSPVYPASFDLDNVISVAAVDNTGNLASFSNYGQEVDIAAPGVGILSTLPDHRYGYSSGTSTAAPFVTGTAALIQSSYPELTPSQVIARIKESAKNVQSLDNKVASNGLVNAGMALGLTADNGEEPGQETPEDTDPDSDNPQDPKDSGGTVETLAAAISPQNLEQIHYGETGVNIATGNFSETFTDLSVPSPGFTIDISRTYNSKDTRTTSTMGKGWFFGFEGSLTRDTTYTTQWVARLPKGSVQVFIKNSNGTFTANNSRSTLVQKSNGSYVLTTKDQYTYGFKANGRLCWMKDRNGNTITIEVDSTGNVQKITDTANREYTVTYNSSGYITMVTDPMGRTVTYGYDSSNKLVSVTDPAGETIYTYTYDSTSGCLAEIKDISGNTVESLTYTGSTGKEKVSTYQDSSGKISTYTYDSTNSKTTITDQNNRTIIKWYDSWYYVIKTQDPENRTALVEYNTDANGINKYGEEISITDRYGNKTEYIRDDRGNIIKIINPDESFSTYTYDDKNNLISETNELNNTTYYIYGPNRINLLKKAQPLNGTDVYDADADESKFAVTTYTYYSESERNTLGYPAKVLLKAETDPEGNTTLYTYDQYGNIASVTDPENNTTTYTRNILGWVMSSVSPSGYEKIFTYDQCGRVVKTVQDNGETNRILYDSMGRKIQEISPNQYDLTKDGLNSQETSHTYGDSTAGTRYTYNPNGKTASITDPYGNTTTYIYDVYGNLITETKANDSVYLYEYDVMNRLIKVSFKNQAADPDTEIQLLKEYRYPVPSDDSGRYQKIETVYLNAADQAVTTWTYDYRGNIVSQKNPDGGTLTIVYYSNGLVKSEKNANGGTTYYKYDGLNRLSERWQQIESNKYSYSSVTYDNAGRKTADKTGLSLVTLYTVPAEDNLLATYYTYYGNGKVKSVSNTSGAKTAYQYDPDGFLLREDVYTDPDNTNIKEYRNNQHGKPLAMTVHVSSQDIYGISPANGSETLLATSYEYDNNGNLIKTTEPDGIVTAYTYDLMDRLLSTSVTGQDENGSPAVITNSILEYSWQGQPLKSCDALGNITEYGYDPKGRLTRIKKITTDSSNNVTSYITAYEYDRADRKIREVSPANYTGSDDLSTSADLTAMNRSDYSYDLMNRLIVKKDIYKNQPGDSDWITIVSQAYSYDFNGNMTKELDGRGYEAGTGTTDQERIKTGYGTEYTYNYANLKVTALDAVSKDRGLPFTKRCRYDGALRLISVTNAKGAITDYVYDHAGRLTEERARKAENAASAVLKSYRYDLAGNLISETDGLGNTTRYEYNGLNKIRKEVYPSDGTIPEYWLVYKYDLKGNTAYTEDSLGVVDLYTYDSQGRELSHTRQGKDGKDTLTVSQSYDLNGNKIYVTDGNGTVTTNVYDDLNRLIETFVTVRGLGSEPVIHKTVYGYDKNNNQTTVTKYLNEVNTGTYTYVYDPLNRLIEKHDPYTIVEKLVYNLSHLQEESHLVLDSTAGTFAVTTYLYDKNNRLASTTDPEGHSTRQSYDNTGNIAAKIDGNINATKYEYDYLNRLAMVINAKGERTSYTYDLNNNMISQTDGKGNTTYFEYNCANKPVRRIDPGGRTGSPGKYVYNPDKTESYTYYGNGSLATKTDRKGVIFTYSYDIHGRKVSESTGDITLSYSYDGNDNLLTMTDLTGTTVRTYDELSRVVTKSLEKTGTNTYEYDLTSGLSEGCTAEKTTDLKGNITCKIFDKAGRLAEVRTDGQTTGTIYTYYPNGSKESVIYPDGSSEHYSYYLNNTLEELTNYRADGSIMDTYSYTYDSANNQKTKSEVINGAAKGTTSYDYDVLNRLKRVTEPSGRITEYTYDKAGNRETENIIDGAIRKLMVYTYNEQNRLLSTVLQDGDIKTTTRYTYDNNGNLITKLTEQTRKINPLNPPEPHFGMFIPGQEKDGATEHAQDLVGFAQFFEYDVFNQMTVSSTGSSRVEYTYYGDGLRASKTVNGKTTRFIYEGDKVVLELDGRGNESARNIYGNTLLLREAEGQTFYYMYNGHADVTALISTDGTIAATYYYDAFGNITEKYENPNVNVSNNINYAGYHYDKESGLYYLNARYYDPVTARFLNEDTYYGNPNDPLSLNLYTYCHNEPIMYFDPSGHVKVYGNQTDYNAEDWGDGYTYVDTSSPDWNGTVDPGSIVLGGTEAKGGVGTNVDLSECTRLWGDTRTETSDAIAYYKSSNDIDHSTDFSSQMSNVNIDFYSSKSGENYVIYNYGNTQTSTSIAQDIYNGVGTGNTFTIQSDPGSTLVGRLNGIWVNGTLGCYLDKNGIYHIAQDYWQSYAGYNGFVNSVFKGVTGSLDTSYQFTYNDQDYIIWAWKGNYANLGIGAELGLYYRWTPFGIKTPQWNCDTKDAMPMTG